MYEHRSKRTAVTPKSSDAARNPTQYAVTVFAHYLRE